MLIDTHCHINLMVKKEFDRTLTQQEIDNAQTIVTESIQADVTRIINVGTSVIESKNCIALAQKYKEIYAAIGIHPNDCTPEWKTDVAQLETLAQQKATHKIVAIGEIGFDKYYTGYDLNRQHSAFFAQVDIALTHQLPIIIHSRSATDETLKALERYSTEPLRGIVHCFSDDYAIAQEYVKRNFLIGLGGTITYPKNEALRVVAKELPLSSSVLETDAPYLPPQKMRGKENHPKYITVIAEYIAELRAISFEKVAQETTKTVQGLLF